MKLKKSLADLYNEIRIQEESEPLREKREILQNDITKYLPEEMQSHDIDLNASDIRIFDQGSYKYHTTIKTSVIDRDVAVVIPLDISKHTDPRKIKKYLKNALSHVSTRTVTIKEPCVNVAYYEDGEEWMHIDLPLYAEYQGNLYLARGREFSDTYSWEPADPDGLNDDLCNQINGNDQLRRVIRFIKKWKYEKYKNSTLSHEIPPSIGITYLVCDHFLKVSTDEGDDDLTAIYQVMSNIKNCFEVSYDIYGNIKADITRCLTVKPYSDIFKKMKDSSDTYCVTFYNKLSDAVKNLRDAINVESEHDAGVYVKNVFGDDFIVPPKNVSSALTFSKKEHGFG